MQSIEKFLKFSWVKLEIMIGFLVIFSWSFALDKTEITPIFLFGIFLWPIVVMGAESSMDTLLNFFITINYWYLLACLIAFISEKTKVGKKIIIAITVMIICFSLCAAIFVPEPKYNREARIISGMNQIRSEAQIVKMKDSNYAGVCIDNDIVTLIADIDKNAPTPAICFAEKDACCVTVELNSGDFYCVDSNLSSYSSSSNSCTAENKACK